MHYNEKMNKIILVCISVVMIYLLRVPLFLLYLACLLAFLLNPLYRQFNKITKSSTLSALSSVGLFIGLIYLTLLIFIPAFYNQLVMLSAKLSNLQFSLPTIMSSYISIAAFEQYSSLIQKSVLNNLNQIGSYLVNVISSQGVSLLMFGGRFYLVLVMSFYILKDHQQLSKFLHNTLPNKDFHTINHLIAKILAALTHLIHGQLSIACVSIPLYVLSFYILGFPHSLLLGILAGVASFIPYLGSLFCSSFITLYIINIAPSWFNITSLLAVLVGGNIIESGFLAPYFLVSKLNIHPLLFVMYLLSFGAIFGLPGVILSLPNSVILHIIFRQLFARYIQNKTI